MHQRCDRLRAGSFSLQVFNRAGIEFLGHPGLQENLGHVLIRHLSTDGGRYELNHLIDRKLLLREARQGEYTPQDRSPGKGKPHESIVAPYEGKVSATFPVR